MLLIPQKGAEIITNAFTVIFPAPSTPVSASSLIAGLELYDSGGASSLLCTATAAGVSAHFKIKAPFLNYALETHFYFFFLLH